MYHCICVIPIRYLYHTRYMCHSEYTSNWWKQGFDQWLVMHGHHCSTKTTITNTQQSFYWNHHHAHILFMKPYMTNAIFRNKNLMMFSDHIFCVCVSIYIYIYQHKPCVYMIFWTRISKLNKPTSEAVVSINTKFLFEQ